MEHFNLLFIIRRWRSLALGWRWKVGSFVERSKESQTRLFFTLQMRWIISRRNSQRQNMSMLGVTRGSRGCPKINSRDYLGFRDFRASRIKFNIFACKNKCSGRKVAKRSSLRHPGSASAVNTFSGKNSGCEGFVNNLFNSPTVIKCNLAIWHANKPAALCYTFWERRHAEKQARLAVVGRMFPQWREKSI